MSPVSKAQLNPIPPEPVRILHILHSMTMGGMENRVGRLAAGLDPALFKVSILTFRPPTFRSVVLPEHISVHFHELPSGLHLEPLLKLRDFIRKGRFDIVHTHNWGSMFYGILAAKLAGTPVRFHGEHGLEGNDKIPWKRSLAQKILARMATRIIAVNEPIAKNAAQAWGLSPTKVICIPNGVDLKRFKPKLKDQDDSLPIKESSPALIIFGTVARFSAVKNFPCLIEAFRILVASVGPGRARLVLVGTGPDVEITRRQCQEAGVLEWVSMPGDTQTPEDYYSQFSVYLNTSLYEGMSNTILEAMACGLPVIASDVTGNKDLVTEGVEALFFKSESAVDLATKLARCVLEPDLLVGLGIRARARVEKDFDNRNFIARYRAAYAEALGRPTLTP
jgi:glycosyltransferase involved in cell wall biosynthesis